MPNPYGPSTQRTESQRRQPATAKPKPKAKPAAKAGSAKPKPKGPVPYYQWRDASDVMLKRWRDAGRKLAPKPADTE